MFFYVRCLEILISFSVEYGAFNEQSAQNSLAPVPAVDPAANEMVPLYRLFSIPFSLSGSSSTATLPSSFSSVAFPLSFSLPVHQRCVVYFDLQVYSVQDILDVFLSIFFTEFALFGLYFVIVCPMQYIAWDRI